jgi:hypothetical protein
MNKPMSIAIAALVTLPLVLACAAVPDEEGDTDSDAEVDDETASEAVASATDALTGRTCYCPGKYACGHSTSASYMYPQARAALAAAGVPTSDLTQTYGDATASKGTHCIDTGTSYSAATDMRQSSNPCGRVRKLRMEGFAAWYRTAPEFPGNDHIHAVWAGASGMNKDKKKQVDSFLNGNDGLRYNLPDKHCPITQGEKAAVLKVYTGGGGSTSGKCVAGSNYCGGDKVKGDSNTLYRCNADGSGTLLRKCGGGCRINIGNDDTCKAAPSCVVGGTYCGGDKVDGDPNTLYRCQGQGKTSVVQKCANGCLVAAGTDDRCK